ncbi:MAG: amino acid dehydrogenase [Thermaerobacter sp.]|nr:amino acid dehydrogenase [Thermaerobacter sp.]
MDIFRAMAEHGHEQLIFNYDKASGLRMIIALHDTTLGPGLGGMRNWRYGSEDEAVADALRLSRGMTYKNSFAGIDFGGSKCVIYNDPDEKSDLLLRAAGRFVEMLGGRIYTGEDVGLTPDDVEALARTTRYLVGRPHKSGDPSKAAALGTYSSICASLRHVFGSAEPKDRHVAIQGAGNVGSDLARRLVADGAKVTICDLKPERAQAVADATGATVVPSDAIYDVACDVFSPCALGLILNPQTLPRLKAKIVCGSANNQLETPETAEQLRRMGILYAPDFIVNGGGIVNIADEFEDGGYQRERAFQRVAQIGERLLAVFRRAEAEGITTSAAAERIAEDRIAAIAQQQRYFVPQRP